MATAAIIGGASLIGGYMSSQSQKSAAKSAAKAQLQAADQSTQAQLKMWSTARSDFMPYMEAGKEGLSELVNTFPQYAESTFSPIIEEYGAYELSQLPSTTTGMINPVTGQPVNAFIDGTSQWQLNNIVDPNINALINPQNISGANALATSTQLEQGGVLAPTVPEFQRELNFQFNVEDPSYQIKAQEKAEEINAFLAKQGLLGSTAGQTYFQKEMDKFRADEEQTQYNRALTERNYLTQTDVDRYNLMANRGNTLYGRQYQTGQDLYNRAYQNALVGDERNLNMLTGEYGLKSDLYNKLYGGTLDLTKIGTGMAGQAGSQAIQTGQSIGQNYLAGGNALAQSALAQGQANAGMWNTIGNLPMTYYTAQNYMNPQTNYMANTNAMAGPGQYVPYYGG